MGSQVVLITGALTGTGRAAAIAFAKEGARVVVSGRRDKEGKSLEAELTGLGADAFFVRADVRHDEDVAALLEATVARFGQVDAAVNNAGTEGQPGPVVQQTAESYAATFETNVLGTLLCMKHEMRVMQAQGNGSIINISRPTVTKERQVLQSIRPANTRSKALPNRRHWNAPLPASGSTQWRRARRIPTCWTASRGTRKGRRPWRRLSRSAAQAGPRKSPASSSSWPRTPLPS
jgi:short chain dehydrogenase